MTPCEQTALAYEEAHGKTPSFSGATSAYEWTTVHVHGTTCAKCLQTLKDHHDTAIRSVERGYKRYGEWHHVRCFDWRTLPSFTRSGHVPPRDKTVTLAKALKAPRFRLAMQPYQTAYNGTADWYPIHQYGTSRKLREELIAEAKRQHPCPAQ